MNSEQFLNAREVARLKRETRDLDRRIAREETAIQQIGHIMKNGVIHYYVYPVGGKYKEGTEAELIEYLIKNNYA